MRIKTPRRMVFFKTLEETYFCFDLCHLQHLKQSYRILI